MGYLDQVAAAIVILGWIIRSILRYKKWNARRIKAQGAPLAPKSQAIIEDAQKPVTALPPIRKLPNPRLQTVLSAPSETSRPAVTREATRADFSNAERKLQSFEPSALSPALENRTITPTPKQFPLFENTNDLVRAIILQEILSPPRSRRMSYPTGSPTPPK